MPVSARLRRWSVTSAITTGVLFASGLACAAPAMAATGDPESRSRIDSLLHSRLHDPRLGHNVAFLVIDAATGAVISKQAPGRQMRAASNMKLVTATTALATMGPHRRFQIRVLAGSQTNDIVLQGGGDPLLSRGDLDRLAARTARHLHKGARVVVHVDDGLFPKPTRAHGWVDEYLGNSVGMVQALAIQGDRSMHPSRNAAEAFAVRLRALGIKATVGPNKDAAPDAVVLASFRGHSVAAAIAMMLRNSDSSIAEVLFRQVAITAGRPANWEGSRRAAMEALRGLGLNPAALVLVDGSGLSRDDRLTPSFLTRLLALVRVKERQRFAAIFAPNALPTAGRTGTLARSYGRYSTSPSNCAVGDVRAKTGTIRGTIALSGVAHTRSGQLRIFSIIVNDRPGGYSALSTRRAVDGLVATITGCWH